MHVYKIKPQTDFFKQSHTNAGMRLILDKWNAINHTIWCGACGF